MALLLWLQQRSGSATAAELATQLEVSVRTVYRDVAALQAAGVPLWTETGPGGGIRLVEGWRTTLDGLSSVEAGSLFLGGAGSAAAELGLGAILVSAQTKLLATLPAALRDRADRVRSRFLLDAPVWFHHSEPLPGLAAAADALWADRRLRLGYQRGGEVFSLLVEPLGLVLKAGTWYLVAGVSGTVRTYRVGRIVSAVVVDSSFSRPDDFDLAAWWAKSAAAFNATILRTRVRLRLSPRSQRLLPQVTDTAAAMAALEGAVPDADGWTVVELAVESENVALDQLLRLGGGIEVLEPVRLRAALADEGRAIVGRNS